ncbi:MAG: hypothetical protein J5J06_05555 [Phycisphaerae bacterium]|nr:hypothetical protein [Phycisphaerae bacterium]
MSEERVHGAMPRWVRELEAEGFDPAATWNRIEDLLWMGWDAKDIHAELHLPESKRRSLQMLARKFGPRRRLEQFARFKDALLSGAMELGPDLIQALQGIAAKAVSPNVKESTQTRASVLLIEFTKALTRMMKADAASERQREEKESAAKAIDPKDAVEAIKALYGVK